MSCNSASEFLDDLWWLFDKGNARGCSQLRAVAFPRPFQQRVPLRGLTRHQILRRDRAVANEIRFCEGKNLFYPSGAVRCNPVDPGLDDLGNLHGLGMHFFTLPPPFFAYAFPPPF